MVGVAIKTLILPRQDQIQGVRMVERLVAEKMAPIAEVVAAAAAAAAAAAVIATKIRANIIAVVLAADLKDATHSGRRQMLPTGTF